MRIIEYIFFFYITFLKFTPSRKLLYWMDDKWIHVRVGQLPHARDEIKMSDVFFLGIRPPAMFT